MSRYALWLIDSEIHLLRQSYLDSVLWQQKTLARLSGWCVALPRWVPFRSKLIRRWSREIKRIEAINFLEEFNKCMKQLEAKRSLIQHRMRVKSLPTVCPEFLQQLRR
jgi:hypothetical protein